MQTATGITPPVYAFWIEGRNCSERLIVSALLRKLNHGISPILKRYLYIAWPLRMLTAMTKRLDSHLVRQNDNSCRLPSVVGDD